MTTNSTVCSFCYAWIKSKSDDLCLMSLMNSYLPYLMAWLGVGIILMRVGMSRTEVETTSRWYPLQILEK